MEGWDFMSKLIHAGLRERLEAKFETLTDARPVNYCRLCSPVFALFSLFVVSLKFFSAIILHFD